MRSTRLALLALAGLLPAVITCGGDSTGPQLPAALNLVSGDGQTGVFGQALPSPLVVKVVDASGAGVQGVPVTWSVASGGGSVSPSSSTTDAQGLASTTWTLGLIADSNSATASVAGVVAITPVSFTASAQAGPAAKLAFTVQPSAVVAGAAISPAVQVTVQDAQGNTVTTSTASITLAITTGTGTTGGVLGGTLTQAVFPGIATFVNLTLDKTGASYSLTATSAGLTPATSAAFAVSAAAAAKLSFTVQPANVTAGAAFSPAVQVTVQDALGNTVTSATTSVTLAITSGTGTSGAVLGGTLTRAAVPGVATFANLTLDKAGAGYTLTATSTSLNSVTSAAFAVSVGAAVKLAFTVQPSAVVVGAAISPAVQVTVQDAQGNTVTSATTSVTLAITSGTGTSGAVLGGTLTRAAVAGVATFANLTVDKVGTGYTLTATATSLTSATSTAFYLTDTGPCAYANATSVTVGQTVNGTLASATDCLISGKYTDLYELTLASAANVQVELTSNPGAFDTYLNLINQATSAVVAFDDDDALSIGTLNSRINVPLAAGTYIIQATSYAAGATGAYQLRVCNSAPSTIALGQTLSGTLATTDCGFAASGSGIFIDRWQFTLAAPTTVTLTQTSAAFDARIDLLNSTETSWLASDDNSGGGTNARIVAALQPGTYNVWTNSDSSSATGAYQLSLTGAQGNTVTTSTASITLAITSGTGTSGVALGGTLTQAALNGVATFSNLTLDKVGTSSLRRPRASPARRAAPWRRDSP